MGHTIYAFKEGGMERGLLNIVNHGDPSQFTHTIICLTEAGAFANQIAVPSCRIVELRKKPGHDFGLIRSIAAIAQDHGIDVLHARGWPTLVETAIAARLANVKSTVYGFHGKTMSDLSRRSLLRRAVQALAIRTYKNVVTLNARMRGDLAREAWLPESRITVIANGVDVNRFSPERKKEAVRKQYGLPSERLIVGNVARLDPVKNHEVLLHAVAKIAKHRRPPFLLIVGDGDHRPVLEQLIITLGLTDHVLLSGYREDIPSFLSCMDVYVQSSHYEGFSNTVLEAMASGLPIVASDVGGTRDLFLEGQEGHYFAPNDAQGLADVLTKLQDNESLRKAMGDRARRRAAETFSLETMVRQYERLYEKLVPAC